MTLKSGDKVTVQMPMDHHHGRRGAVELMNGNSAAVKFDDNARGYYTPDQLMTDDQMDGDDEPEQEMDPETAMLAKRACVVIAVASNTEDDDLMEWAEQLATQALYSAALAGDHGFSVGQCEQMFEMACAWNYDEQDLSKSIDVHKSQPNSSSVHVPTMIGNKDKIGKEKAHDRSNIEELKSSFAALNAALDKFLTEEEGEDVDKDADEEDDSDDGSGKAEPAQNTDPATTGYYATNPDSNPDMYPDLDNLDAQVLKDEEEDSNDNSDLLDMQQLVEGMDWELEHTTIIPEEAQELAMQQLETDPDHYKKLRLQADGSDDVLTKDTQQTEEDPFAGEGFNLDLGSGTCREPGFLGLDLYPYDHGTIIHDVHMGLPFPDGSASKVKMANSLHTMDDFSQDPKGILSEIHRVLKPGGQFLYEGPKDIYDSEQWAKDFPGFVMVNHEDGVQKDSDGEGAPVRQQFTRLATPDPATANDAEPRIGVAQYDQLPADALLATDALGYYWSDATSSGRGNRLHGYPSQGALAGPDDNSPSRSKQGSAKKSNGYYRLSKDQMAEMNASNPDAMTMPEQQVHHAFNRGPVNPLPPKKVGKSRAKKGGPGSGPQGGNATGSSNNLNSLDRRPSPMETHANAQRASSIARDRHENEKKEQKIREQAHRNVEAYQRQASYYQTKSVEKIMKSERIIPILKMDNAKQIVYGVVLAPDEIDAQDDFMTSDDIEKAAHKYLADSRVIGSNHSQPIQAHPVESFIAPQDFEMTGQYGNQPVKKGSWVLGVKVTDPHEWEKIVDGDYTGFSVGGVGARQQT